MQVINLELPGMRVINLELPRMRVISTLNYVSRMRVFLRVRGKSYVLKF